MTNKTETEIRAASLELSAQADALPPESVFGDDNTDDIELLNNYSQELLQYADGNGTLNEEVIAWIEGRPSEVGDSLV